MTVSVPGKYWRLSVGIVIGEARMGIAPPMHAALTVLVGEPFGSFGTMMPLGHTAIYLVATTSTDTVMGFILSAMGVSVALCPELRVTEAKAVANPCRDTASV